MEPAIIAVLGTLIGGALLKFAEYRLGRPKKKAIDWHWVRAQEMEVWGEYFSELQCGPDCKTCKEERRAIKAAKAKKAVATRGQVQPPKSVAPRSGPVSAGLNTCTNCSVPVLRAGNMCQRCMTNRAIEKRHALEAKKNEMRERRTGLLRYRHIGNARILIPTEVPDNAFAAIHYDPRYMCDFVHWKWTDAETGQQKAMRSMIPYSVDKQEYETHEVYSHGSEKPVLTFRTPSYD